MLDTALRHTLLEVAARAIRHRLATGAPLPLDPLDYRPPLREPRATFVTLERHGELRGCIGTLEAHRPLVADVAANAQAAAFSDPRFVPLSAAELQGLELHISILGLPEPLAFGSERELLAQIRPGIDGLILSERGRRATFLPSVWESLPDPREFLLHLKTKAGLPAGYWSDTVEVQRYTTESFGGGLTPDGE